MMGIDVTAEEKRELKRKGSLVRIDYDTQEFEAWHNPKTGQEFPRLPSDSYSIRNYMRKGLIVGPASEELREKWEADRPERETLSVKRIEEAKKSPLHRDLEGSKEQYKEDDIQKRVEQGVLKTLETLGIEIPKTPEQTEEVVETEQKEVQLEMKLF